jgi:Flp pilus assembly protein protease CpaA
MIASETITARHSITMTISKRNCWFAALALPLVVGPLWCIAGTQLDLTGPARWLGTLAGFVLLATLATCAATDVRGNRIYNWTTYSAFLWAITVNVVASTWPTAPPEWLGGVGIGQSFGGAALCFLITLAGYHMSGRGAGDVKLAAVLGALMGIHHGIFAVAYSYIVAAVAIIIWSTWVNGPLAIAKAAVRSIGKLFGHLWPWLPTASDSALMLKPIPLGPYFAIGTLLVVLELVPTWQ